MKNITPSIPTYVISLERRQDRRNHFIEKNKDKVLSWSFFDAFDAKGIGLTYDKLKKLGYDTDQTWKDQDDGQHLSVGGVGCSISHLKLYDICVKLDTPILILEDDVIIEENINYQEIIDLFNEGYNLVYVSYSEWGTSKPVEGKTGLVIPDKAYCTSSYAIAPEAAKILGDKHARNNIIQMDQYINSRNLNLLNTFEMKDEFVSEDVELISNYIVDEFIKNQYTSVKLIYSHFNSVANQKPEIIDLLPFKQSENNQNVSNHIFEPNQLELIFDFAPKYVFIMIHRAILDSLASEHAARMVAMQNATDNANELVDDLTLDLNKARQETITSELLDLVGGMSAIEN